MKTAKKVLTYLVIVGIAVICALSYEVFIFPNKFAPAGLNGICTMIQYVLGISVGYLSLLTSIFPSWSPSPVMRRSHPFPS